MERKIFETRDGSPSISIPEWNVMYHSIHGAIQESLHVFIDAGLSYVLHANKPDVHILEMGMGTGLNVWLTAKETGSLPVNVRYTTLELFPLTDTETDGLQYGNNEDERRLFRQIHALPWGTDVQLLPNFTLTKIHTGLLEYTSNEQYDLIYYDAFAPSAQPELWTPETFTHVFKLTAYNGVLVTYCSKSIVRKALQAAGFTVQKIPGPWGKREMLRAIKLSTT